MNNSKGISKLITYILIIMIITVVGSISYYCFDYFKNKRIEKEALDEVADFDYNIPTLTLAEYEKLIEDKIINEVDNENIDDDFNSSSGSSSSSNSNSNNSLYTIKTIGTIRIPKTDIKYPIYSPAGEKALEKGIGMLTTEKGLNKPGNTVLQGHNWRNWMFFSRNNKLSIGDSVFIKDKRGVEIEYIIYKKMTLKPTDSKYIVRNTEGMKEISLSTCTNAAKDRLVILAKEK